MGVLNVMLVAVQALSLPLLVGLWDFAGVAGYATGPVDAVPVYLHVEILDEVCGNQDPRVIDTGWVPAQSPAGAQWAWFWSRGC